MSYASYDLMFSCWHFEPNDRPTFNDIIRTIDCIDQSNANGVFHVDKMEKSEWLIQHGIYVSKEKRKNLMAIFFL